MDKEVSEMASLRVRHRVQTQHIVQVNDCLSSFQKERLKSTPFKWLVDMVDDMVISSPILIELISLPNVGESVNLENDVGGIVNDLFKDEDITILNSLGHKRRTRYGIDKAMEVDGRRPLHAQEDARPQNIKLTLDLLVDARPYVRRWHMDARLALVQTLDQMDAHPDAHPEGRLSRRSSRRSSRRTLVQTLVQTLDQMDARPDAHPEGRSSRSGRSSRRSSRRTLVQTLVQTLDQMDARPNGHPEGRSSRRTLVQTLIQTLIQKDAGPDARPKVDARLENWTLVQRDSRDSIIGPLSLKTRSRVQNQRVLTGRKPEDAAAVVV
ncbi:hypothetical protein LR48_Vigan05g038100 [Vigna angularis]|uniref:Uncharacterized protein n=1 Tax=Phaseolus angularis TaxID=3914 RepID=A0A0L9UJN4_PHAAN|nr:hypothetical protein LR48_Vigan05g038100 [Vigna angularis]